MFDYFMIALLCLVIYIMLYVLVDRICKCFEHCANAKYYVTYHTKVNTNGTVQENK